MGVTIEQMRKQLNEFWQGMDKGKKIKIGISTFLILTSITGIIYFTTRTNYEVLYSNLSLKDTGNITSKLDELGVKWEIGENGNTVLVPSGLKNKVKIQLATEGLPEDSYTTIEAFNDSSWTMTEYEKKQRLKYALQNELAATISEIDGIEKSTVYIEIPESSGFLLDDTKQATASVFLKIGGNSYLTSDKVTAIKNLVASSVGMNAENVSVVDDNGNLLTENNNSVEGYNLTEQLNLQQSLQNKFNDSIKRFLENIFGFGNVDVRTNVKVNFDSEITSIVEFTPPIEGNEDGLIRSMEEIEEHMVNGSEGGIAGVEANSEDTTDYAQQSENDSKFDKASRTINYELNEINKQIRKAPGQIEAITVAILINQDVLTDGELSDARREEISDLIYAATGLDTKQVNVNAYQFNNTSTIDGSNPYANETDSNNTPVWLYYLIGALALSGVSGMIIINRRKKEADYNINEVLEQKSAAMAQVEEIDFESEKSQIKSQINKFVDKKPDAVAQLLRSWLNEE